MNARAVELLSIALAYCCAMAIGNEYLNWPLTLDTAMFLILAGVTYGIGGIVEDVIIWGIETWNRKNTIGYGGALQLPASSAQR